MKRKKGKSDNRLCCVSTCDGINNGTVTYHQFPKAGTKVIIKNSKGVFYCDRRKVWEDRVGADFPINKYTKVCSLHFTDEDYSVNTRRKKGYRRLLPSAVPSLRLPHEEFSDFKTVGKSLKLQKKNSNCGKDLSEDHGKPLEELIQTKITAKAKVTLYTSLETYWQDTNTQPARPANHVQRDVSCSATDNLETSAIFVNNDSRLQNKETPPPSLEDSSEGTVFETIVIFQTEELDVFENDIKEEIDEELLDMDKTTVSESMEFKLEEIDIKENDVKEEVKSDSEKSVETKREDEELLDALLMQTSYEMEKFAAGTCSTYSFL